MHETLAVATLTADEIDGVLRRQQVGRLAGVAGDRVLIEPVVFEYEGGSVYASSHFDEIARCLPDGCPVILEVEEIESPASLWVVILKGIFHLLQSPQQREAALKRIMDQAGIEPANAARHEEEERNLAVYRIQVTDRSGRYEGFPPWASNGRGEGRPYIRYVPIYAEPAWDWR